MPIGQGLPVGLSVGGFGSLAPNSQKNPAKQSPVGAISPSEAQYLPAGHERQSVEAAPPLSPEKNKAGYTVRVGRGHI